MAVQDPISQRLLLEWFLALRVPKGFRAELIEGEFVMTPPPDGDHEDFVNRVTKQVVRHSATDMDFSGSKGLRLRGSGDGLEDHVLPDRTFVPAAHRSFRGAAPWTLDTAAMVLDVTSPGAGAGREARRRCFARGGIPLYLLVDRETTQITVFGDPQDDDYREHRTLPFGKPLALPEPFAFDLETGDLL